jgi:hypothetical protein
VRTRILARVTTVAAAAAVPVLVTAAPALASYKPDDGEVRGPSLGAGLTLLYFVVIPLAVFGVIVALSLLPSALARPRYRPGRPWNFNPLWFRGPDDPDSALVDARPGATARGGASAEW